MDPARKRRIRLIVSLSAALLLATALVYTSFGASSEAKTPSQLLQNTQPDRSYQLTGKVVPKSIRKDGDVTTFEIQDRTGPAKVSVRYEGAIPDPFRDGREVIITVRGQGAEYVGERDSLITKCPSKFSDEQPAGTDSPVKS
jgi:cytochrome c-type biogenesis protein CcmE